MSDEAISVPATPEVDFAESEATVIAADLWAAQFHTEDKDLDDVLNATVTHYTLSEAGLMFVFLVPEIGRHPLELVRKLRAQNDVIGRTINYEYPVRVSLISYRGDGTVAWLDRYGLSGLNTFAISGAERCIDPSDACEDAQVLCATFRAEWIDPDVKPSIPLIRSNCQNAVGLAAVA